jgi:uncharacterized repeat protein (TIGR01451 family)
MQALQRLKSSIFHRSRHNCVLVGIFLLGNLFLASSFICSPGISGGTAYAASLKYVSAKSNQKLSPSTSVERSLAQMTIALTKQPNNLAVSNGDAPVAFADISISQSNAGGHNFQVGQIVTYTLTIASIATKGPIRKTQSVKVKDVLPSGLKNVIATGTNWKIIISSPVSPTLIAATYRGSYPIAPGTILPPIVVTGQISSTAPTEIISTATVDIPYDVNPDNNMANNTINVAPLSS